MDPTVPMQASEPKADWSPLPGVGRGFMRAEWLEIFRSNGLRNLEDFFSVSGEPLAKPGLGKRYRARLPLNFETRRVTAFLKRYDGEKLRLFLQRWWEEGERMPVAEREVRVANALRKIGIATFQPLAWGWRGDWGVKQKSFLVMSQVPGKSLEHWLDERPLAATRESWQQKKDLTKELALLARTLHGAGFFHRDFYLCHIFVSETDGNLQLALLDLARVFRPRWRVERWRMKDLAQLNFSAPKTYFSRTMRLRFARVYFGFDRMTDAHKQLMRRILRRSAGIARREG